jgi:hypothetical protein
MGVGGGMGGMAGGGTPFGGFPTARGGYGGGFPGGHGAFGGGFAVPGMPVSRSLSRSRSRSRSYIFMFEGGYEINAPAHVHVHIYIARSCTYTAYICIYRVRRRVWDQRTSS